jgi:hypothetical protein
MFGPEKEEVAGDWRTLHNEELHRMYCEPNINRIMKSMTTRWAGHVACIRQMINACRILVGNPECKRPFGRSSCRLEDNIRRGLTEKFGVVDWIHLAQNRANRLVVVKTEMKLRVP